VYTAIKELMVCEALIAASEGVIVCTSQKGKQFYDLLLKKQEQRDNSCLSLRPSTVLPLEYDCRSPDAIYYEWKVVGHK
jgi:hypothetical protein